LLDIWKFGLPEFNRHKFSRLNSLNLCITISRMLSCTRDTDLQFCFQIGGDLVKSEPRFNSLPNYKEVTISHKYYFLNLRPLKSGTRKIYIFFLIDFFFCILFQKTWYIFVYNCCHGMFHTPFLWKFWNKKCY